MHTVREKRVREELKDAKALSLTLNLNSKIEGLPVTCSLRFEGMPTLLYKANGKHIAKCLPLNLLGTGDDKDSAFNELGEDLAEALGELIHESSIFKHITDLLQGSAAKIYWDTHAKLQKKQREIADKEIKRRIPEIPNFNIQTTTATQINPSLAEYQEYSRRVRAVGVA